MVTFIVVSKNRSSVTVTRGTFLINLSFPVRPRNDVNCVGEALFNSAPLTHLSFSKQASFEMQYDKTCDSPVETDVISKKTNSKKLIMFSTMLTVFDSSSCQFQSLEQRAGFRSAKATFYVYGSITDVPL